jgi:hypothetical protein
MPKPARQKEHLARIVPPPYRGLHTTGRWQLGQAGRRVSLCRVPGILLPAGLLGIECPQNEEGDVGFWVEF